MDVADRIGQAHRIASDYEIPWRSIPQLLEKRCAEQPGKSFLVFYDNEGRKKEFTYAQFLERVAKTAAVLKALGISRGDSVATIMYNHCDTVCVYFACWHIGATVVPINCAEGDEHVRFTFENAGVKACFFFAEFAGRMEALGDMLQKDKMIAVGEAEGFSSYEKLLEAAKPVPGEASRDDKALIVYTSGTTGKPKGVVLSQGNLLIDADAIAEHNRFAGSDKFMCVLPIHHVNGITVTLMTPLYAGASVVLNQRFQSHYFWKRIADEGVTAVSVVPTLLAFVLEASSRSDASGTPLRRIICGAGPLTVELAARFEDTFGLRITHGYGLSETTCYSCYVPVDSSSEEHRKWMRDYGFPSIGIAIKANEMDIHDAGGVPLGEGQRGEIVIRGKNVMLGYLNREEANREAFAHNWFRSGDEGFYLRDARGRKYFFITGRIKELIIRGGINISPLEIDEVLNALPGVKRAVAVGFENKWYGEEVGACVHMENGSAMKEEDVLRHCQQRLSFFKSPKAVVFVDDVPVTSTGKYQRNKLRRLFAAWRDVQFREPKAVTRAAK